MRRALAIIALAWLVLSTAVAVRAQTQPRQALIEVHDPDKGVYLIAGYADYIKYDGAGLYVLMHTDADAIFRGGFEP